MSNEDKAKTEEARRHGELMLDELEAVSGGLAYELTNTYVSSYSLSGSHEAPTQSLSL